MATLNDDFDGEDTPRPAEEALSWHWRTWPSNLRTALVVLVCAIAVGAALFALARWVDKDLSKQLKQQSTLQGEAKSKLMNSDQERKDIETHLPLLNQLDAAGIYGEEKRLEWIELLRNIEKRWPGVRIQYSISAQTLQPSAGASVAPAAAPALPGAPPIKNLGVFTTEMKLTLRLLHEGDALAITQEIKAAQLGHFSVRSCSFKRPAADTQNISAAALNFGKPVEADCSLTWTSMRTYAPT